ncbi:glycosyltransferase family 4 protein [Actinokineospora sp. PR83]|uniref:glycosyltransferase family 4 protein n=1 Tax=Actinokineospora sp. PR83 TaxID=2884908 RepID=UPI0027E1BE3B|nr:glycosyltransferase family 4 protein [Actinokineospora sp. PR83]MCG8920750.1 glycosyltransferase family 4 protein [Actinokineospora sp. PR83]
MRVLQVTDNYAPATGGLERVVQLLSHELAARGHEVHVATLSRTDAPDLEAEGPVTVHRLSGLTRHLRRFSADPNHLFHPTVADPVLVRRLQELVDELRPDVVHVHSWILHSCLSLRLPSSSLVVSLHDYGLTCAKKTLTYKDSLDTACSGPELRKCLGCAKDFYGAVKGTALTLGLSRTRLDEVDLFLPISDAMARACLPGVAPERIRVVPSFVADSVAAVGSRPDFLPDGDFVLFVGALGEHKGLGPLVEAHRRMAAAVPLVVIGPRRADTPELLGSPERPVVVHDSVPHPQIMAAFAAAAVVAVPSRWAEPQGLVAVEALAVGTPVVASRVGGLPGLVTDGVTGLLVPPGDASALAGALDSLLADPVARSRMGAAGRVDARRYFAGAVVPQVVAAYEELVDRRSTVPR